MRRRVFIAAFGGAVAWPMLARGQQPTTPVIGLLFGGLATSFEHNMPAFRAGLNESGYVEGRNVMIEYRFAEGDFGRLPALATDLVSRNVAVIWANAPSAALAAKAATSTIPIVFGIGADPVKLGLVASLGRPDGNVTGVNFFANDLEAKRLGLLHEMVPKAELIAVLLNPDGPNFEDQSRDIDEAARALGLKLHIERASSESEIDAAFAALAQQRAGALLVGADPYYVSKRALVVASAAKYRLPAIYQLREFAEAGGLMSYGASLAEAHRLGGLYTGRILKGAKPTDLPVVQTTKFEFVINLKTAKALGIDAPPAFSARADEVIE
jgi:putative ABC transport system substrate-binding protein